MSDHPFSYPNADAAANPLNFKVTHASQQLARRLRFPTPPSHTTLSSKLLSLWASSGLTAANLTLSYVDQDGDRVVLSSDEELQGFYDELRGAGKEKEVVRMRVVLSKGEGADERGAPDQSGMDVELETTTATTTTAEKKDEDKLDTASATTEVHPAAQTKGINGLFVYGDFIKNFSPTQADIRDRDVSMTPVDDVPAANPHTASGTVPSGTETPIVLFDDGDVTLLGMPPADSASASAPVAADDDPEEVFPAAADAATDADTLPTPTDAAPSLLADLSLLLTSITSSPALANILARAAQGAYTPELTQKGVHVKVQMDHVRDELAKGLGEAGKGVKQAETVVNGLAKAVMEGLEQVNEVRRERDRARAANATAPTVPTEEAPTEKAQDEQAEKKTQTMEEMIDAVHKAAAKGPEPFKSDYFKRNFKAEEAQDGQAEKPANQSAERKTVTMEEFVEANRKEAGKWPEPFISNYLKRNFEDEYNQISQLARRRSTPLDPAEIERRRNELDSQLTSRRGGREAAFLPTVIATPPVAPTVVPATPTDPATLQTRRVNMFVPPAGPPPAVASVPGAGYTVPSYHRPAFVPQPHHRHSFPVPGAFPDVTSTPRRVQVSGYAGTPRRGPGGGRGVNYWGAESTDATYARLSATLADMGFQEAAFGEKLREEIEAAGEGWARKGDQEIVAAVVRMLVAGM